MARVRGGVEARPVVAAGVDQCFLIREVAVHRRALHPRLFGDPAHGRARGPDRLMQAHTTVQRKESFVFDTTQLNASTTARARASSVPTTATRCSSRDRRALYGLGRGDGRRLLARRAPDCRRGRWPLRSQALARRRVLVRARGPDGRATRRRRGLRRHRRLRRSSLAISGTPSGTPATSPAGSSRSSLPAGSSTCFGRWAS